MPDIGRALVALHIKKTTGVVVSLDEISPIGYDIGKDDNYQLQLYGYLPKGAIRESLFVVEYDNDTMRVKRLTEGGAENVCVS